MAGIRVACIEIPIFTGNDIINNDQLVVPGLPTDGSIGLAFLRVDPALAVFISGFQQYLLAFTGQAGQSSVAVDPVAPGAPPQSVFLPAGWKPL